MKKIQKRRIRCFFRFHYPLNCTEYSEFGLGSETRIKYMSAWSAFGTKETQYQCQDCGRKFWYTKGDFNVLQCNARFLEYLNNIKQ